MDNLLALTTGMVLAGDYRIEAVLGAGGFGITYLARETTLDRRVAIKEYFPSDFATRGGTTLVRAKSKSVDADYAWGLERFIEEAQTLARFDHPHITRVFRYFRENNTGYMVLQFEEGRSFKAWLDALKRPPTQDELDRIAAPLLDALELIHDSDFLHRDIAPDNIIIRSDGMPVLIDFGSARGEIAEHSKTVSALVKPGYSPFEQYAITGKRQGPWTDIYALGATLYHAVTGGRPLDAPTRMTSDDLDGAAAAAQASYRPGFLAAIDRALAIGIEDRPQSVKDWRIALFSVEPAASPARKERPRPLAQPAQVANPPGGRTRKIEDDALPAPAWRARRENKPQPDAGSSPRPASGIGKSAHPIARAEAQPGQGPARAAAADVRQPPRGPRRSLIDLLAEAKAEVATLLPTIKRRAGVAAAAIGDAARARMPELGSGEAAAAPAPGGSLPPGSPGSIPVTPTPARSAAEAGAQAGAEAGAEAGAQAKPKRKPPEPAKPAPAKTRQPVAADPNASANKLAAQKAAAKKTAEQQAAAQKAEVQRVAVQRAADKAANKAAARQAAAEKAAAEKAARKVAAERAAAEKAATNEAAARRRADAARAKQVAAAAAKAKADARKAQNAAAGSSTYRGRLVQLGLIVSLVSAIVYFQDGWPTTRGSTGQAALATPDFGLVRTLRGHELPVVSVAISPDGKRVISAAGSFINVWSYQTGEIERVLSEPDGDVTSVDAMGDRVLAGVSDGSLVLWNADTGQRLESLKRHDGPVWSVAFADNENRFFSASQDKRVRVWDLRWGTRRSMLGHENAVLAVAHGKEQNMAVSGGVDSTVRLWTGSRPRLARVFRGHTDDVRAVAIDNEAQVIASASFDKTVKLWSVKDGELLATLEGHSNRVVAVAFSPDGSLVASGSEDGTIKLWNVATHALIHTYVGHSDPVRSVVFAPDGQHLISAGDDKTVRIWNARAGATS